MADLTITQTVLPGGKVRYELGTPDWEARRIPDIRQPGSSIQVPANRLIDVVILGDGFTAAGDFLDALDDWLGAFYALDVYEVFAGALRIRALYTPSGEPASIERDSYYRCRVSDDEEGMSRDDSWWSRDDPDGMVFRQRLWASVDSFGDIQLRRYSTQLDLGDDGAIGNWLRNIYRNLVVSMLVRTAVSDNVSGMARDVPREPPDDERRVRVAFGANAIHEFSHAFGLLSDEYIDGRDTESNRSNPSTPSVFTLSNLSYSNRDDSVPWLHLGPTGRFRRTASGSDPSPLVGWLWVGGGRHKDVWHAEYRCLMNGTHDNFAFTQVTENDPTANADGTYTDENGEPLRDIDRFCSWCQEIVVVRLLEKSDQLLEPGDPSDPTEQGHAWYARWVDRLQGNYFDLLAVRQQLLAAEAQYTGLDTRPKR